MASIIIDDRIESTNGVKVGIKVSDFEQIDHHPEGFPYVAHQSYLTENAYGSRRVGFGVTPDQALAIGLLNAARYPVNCDVPTSATIPNSIDAAEA